MDKREVNRGDQGEIPEEGIVGKGSSDSQFVIFTCIRDLSRSHFLQPNRHNRNVATEFV